MGSERSLALAVLALAAGTVLTASPRAAWGHGDASHAPAGAVKPEQKRWGVAGKAKAAGRSIEFRMSDDMRFTPDRIAVKQGETLRLVLRNDGKLLHEFVLGTQQALDEHAALMLKFPGMEHDEPYMAHVPPGKTGEIVWHFNRAGEFAFACLIAGHYQAGMVGKFSVVPGSPATPGK